MASRRMERGNRGQAAASGAWREETALLWANLARTGRWACWVLAAGVLLKLGHRTVWPYVVARCAGRGADLTAAALPLALLRGGDLVGASMRGADLWRADLSGADLTASELQKANLEGANLAGTRLVDTHMEGANLRGADLSRAIFISVYLKRAFYDRSTRWPAVRYPGAFDFRRAGAILVK